MTTKENGAGLAAPLQFTERYQQSMNKKKSSGTSYEMSTVHPAVAKWLTDHDYTYQHEVYMPDYGRADFVATHDDGHILIIECKQDCSGATRAITQVRDYREQYNKKARIGLGVPLYTVTDQIRA